MCMKNYSSNLRPMTMLSPSKKICISFWQALAIQDCLNLILWQTFRAELFFLLKARLALVHTYSQSVALWASKQKCWNFTSFPFCILVFSAFQYLPFQLFKTVNSFLASQMPLSKKQPQIPGFSPPPTPTNFFFLFVILHHAINSSVPRKILKYMYSSSFSQGKVGLKYIFCRYQKQKSTGYRQKYIIFKKISKQIKKSPYNSVSLSYLYFHYFLEEKSEKQSYIGPTSNYTYWIIKQVNIFFYGFYQGENIENQCSNCNTYCVVP